MVRKVIISKSKLKNKRLRVDMLDFPSMDNHFHNFGEKGARTYIDHGDDKKKSAWVARFSTSKSWDNIHSPLYFSRMLLWNTNNFNKNIRILAKKLDATIVDRTK
jgi:hypothetical protein